jgi:TRAP-type transport system periplasmic protein
MKITNMGQSLLAGLLCLLSSASCADPVKLKFAFFATDSESTWISVLKPFVEAVNKDGAGIVEIEPYLNGALSRNLPQQPQIVLDGVADMAFVIPGITPGRFADNTVIELPGIFQNARDSSLAYLALSRSGQMHGYEKYYIVAAFGAVPSSIHTKKPVKSLNDLKGMKIRATNATEEKVIRALGAASVLLPTNDAAEAIARNTIDGTAMQPVPLVDFGIARLTNYHYQAHMGIAPLAVLMNREKYNSLPQAAKDVIDRYSGRWIVDHYTDMMRDLTRKIVADWKADSKQIVLEPTPEEATQLALVYKGIADAYSAQNDHNAALLSALRDEVQKINAGN